MKKNTILPKSKTGTGLGRKIFSGNRAAIRQASALIGILLLSAAIGFSQNPAQGSGNCPPKVALSSILDGLRVNGKLHLGELQVYCLPKPAKRTSGYIYEPNEGVKFVSILRNSSGLVMNAFVWYGVDYLDRVKMTHYEIVGGPQALRELSAGDYTLEFALGNRVFQSFPFTVITKESTDIYRPGTIYLLEGAWRDEAVLTSPTIENVMCFNFRLRAGYELADVRPTAVQYDLSLIRDRDNQLVAESRGGTLLLESAWKSYRTCFDRPDRKAAQDISTLKLKEIAAVNGSYTIRLALDGKPYASYKFVVSGGRINGEELPVRYIRLILPATILRK